LAFATYAVPPVFIHATLHVEFKTAKRGNPVTNNTSQVFYLLALDELPAFNDTNAKKTKPTPMQPRERLYLPVLSLRQFFNCEMLPASSERH
jgi:hypothetical protein